MEYGVGGAVSPWLGGAVRCGALPVKRCGASSGCALWVFRGVFGFEPGGCGGCGVKGGP